MSDIAWPAKATLSNRDYKMSIFISWQLLPFLFQITWSKEFRHNIHSFLVADTKFLIQSLGCGGGISTWNNVIVCYSSLFQHHCLVQCNCLLLFDLSIATGRSWMLMSKPRKTCQRSCGWYLCQSLGQTITRSLRQVIVSYFGKFLGTCDQNINVFKIPLVKDKENRLSYMYTL